MEVTTNFIMVAGACYAASHGLLTDAGRLPRHCQENQHPLHGQEPVQEDPSAPLKWWTRLVRTLRPIACLRWIWANRTAEEIGRDTVREANEKAWICQCNCRVADVRVLEVPWGMMRCACHMCQWTEHCG